MAQRLLQVYSDKAEIADLRRLAAEVFGLKFPKVVQSGSARNAVGIKSDHLLVSRRLDSRTYFVQDNRHGVNKEAGVFRGSEREQIKICKEIFRALGLPLSEIDTAIVLKEQTQVAQVDRQTREVRTQEVREGKHIVWLTRKIEGIPVWDSRLLLSLTKDKKIGFMELHWPEISEPIVREAHRLAYKMRRKWTAPDHPGAIVEKVESGIIHSPAIGFIMDIYPTIRVTYKSTGRIGGVRPVLYFDRDANPIPYPRQAELPMEVPKQRELLTGLTQQP